MAEGKWMVDLVTGLACAVGLFFYFVPTLLAFDEERADRRSIILVNVFAGWTLIGWFVALWWVARKGAKSQGRESE